MPTRLPKANTYFNHYDNANLVTQGQNVVNGMTTSVADFPTPPISLVDLQSAVGNYSTALSLSMGGSKQQRTAMRAARTLLKNNLRQTCNYVNQVIYDDIAAGTSYSDAQDLITGTGFQLSLDPTPAGPLAKPTVRTYGSPQIGQLYVLLEKLVGAKTYQMNIGLAGSDQSTWKVYTFPNTRMTLPGLTSGQQYQFMLMGVGASTVRTFSDIFSQVII